MTQWLTHNLNLNLINKIKYDVYYKLKEYIEHNIVVISLVIIKLIIFYVDLQLNNYNMSIRLLIKHY